MNGDPPQTIIINLQIGLEIAPFSQYEHFDNIGLTKIFLYAAFAVL